MDLPKEVVAAETRIRPYIRKTPLDASPYLSHRGGATVLCKLENFQHTGAFKLRGAMNRLLAMSPEERGRGVVTASTGNHGAGIAFSLNRLKSSGIVFVPETTPMAKVQAITRLGAEVRRHGQDCAETESHARQFAEQNRMTYISPYNDPLVVAGQGTIAVELAGQAPSVDAVFVALGGGGLISGIGGYIKSISPKTRIIGCSPENSMVMIESVKAGSILDLPSLPTLSDSTAGGVEPGAITFDLCRTFVDDYITVTEEEIRESLCSFMEAHHMLIEGAAAVPVAAYLKECDPYRNKTVVIIICGANISLAALAGVLGKQGVPGRGLPVK